MHHPKLMHLVFLLTIFKAKSQKYENHSSVVGYNILARLNKIPGLFLQNCWSLSSYKQHEDIFPFLQDCLKEKAVVALTRLLQSDSIQILNGVELVKIKERRSNFIRKLDDNVGESDWESRMLLAIADVLETHMLKIHLENLLKQDTHVNEGRRRPHRRDNMMMSLMMFGVLAMGMLLIPMGFKFLTVLGAKALLLAKMALILTSIQGLKKVATSGINYGLYHSPSPLHHDRHGLEDIPDDQLDYYNHIRS